MPYNSYDSFTALRIVDNAIDPALVIIFPITVPKAIEEVDSLLKASELPALFNSSFNSFIPD